LDEGLIHVRERADKRNVIGIPKSKKSRRCIPIGPKVVQALREWNFEWQSRGGEQGLVFPTAHGGKILALSSIVRIGLVPSVIAAGLKTKWDGTGKAKEWIDDRGMTPKYTGMHAFRHFHASLCLNPAGRGGLAMTPQEVQARMVTLQSESPSTLMGICSRIRTRARRWQRQRRPYLGDLM
jgi:integrase